MFLRITDDNQKVEKIMHAYHKIFIIICIVHDLILARIIEKPTRDTKNALDTFSLKLFWFLEKPVG